jgi:N-acetyl-gamma-glutamyl-phosphate/LysW-gamma-L-alpha-aminoadipyl-6-phosphate reductase
VPAPSRVPTVLIGGTGYGGAELLRLLLDHPGVDLRRVTAVDHVGQRVGDVHWTLHDATDLVIEDIPPVEAATGVGAEVALLGLPHGVSVDVAPALVDAGVRVVDLSGDFRLTDPALYERYYGKAHPRPDLLDGHAFVYGLPELHREAIASARNIASPGCFATCLILGVLPLARAGLLRDAPVRAVACTGSSGSGVSPSAGTHHPIRAANLRTYRALQHQHTPEVVRSLAEAGSPGARVDWVPVSAPLVRGILATAFVDLPAGWDAARVRSLYEESYDTEPFVRLLPAGGRMPEVVAIAGTMTCEVGLAVEGRTLVAVAALDNLVKGGAGQAVQSLNLMLGLPESTGLQEPGLWP